MQKAWSYVPEYASAPKIDIGAVVNTAGHPVSGATVLLFPVIRGYVKPGTVVQALARAVTGADGRFAIHLPSNRRQLLMGAHPWGYVNLHVMAFYPGELGSWTTPIRTGATTPASHPLILEQDHIKVPVNAERPSIDCQIGDTVHVPVDIQIGWKDSLDSTLDYASYTYNSDTSSQMGAGISYSGEYGGFSDDGTTSQNTSGSYTWPHMAGEGTNALLGAGLYYNEFWQCGVSGYWYLAFNSVNTSAGSPGASPISAGDCATLEHNTIDSYGVGSQKTWIGGVDLKDDGFNIDLSSQDGWNEESYLTFAAGADDVPICGVNNKPDANNPSAGELQAH
jgi:hypothetical protein